MQSDERLNDKGTKLCHLCGRLFAPDLRFCPNDGTELTREAGPANTVSLKESRPNSSDANAVRRNALSHDHQLGSNFAHANKSPIHTLVGQTLDNQYEILSLIGQGGMSVVYKARHLMLKKIVAIKTLLPHLVLHPLSLQRFRQEAQAASNIDHINVVTIYNFGITPEGQPYLVMDYLQGISLQALITEVKHLPVERAVNIFLQVTNALSHAHEKGVIHRDLKPSNIILIEQGDKKDVVQLVDFGIAKLLPQEGIESVNLTQTGELFGSPLYMSPEQCKGEKLDPRSDLYSMGCLMYETLCGTPALLGANTLEILYKHIHQMPISMDAHGVKIPARLEAIVFRCLAKSPSDRYQSMEELEHDLESFLKSQQFSLIGILKSRWELSRLKKMPESKREKLASLSAFAFIAAAIILLAWPLINFWNLADSPLAKPSLSLLDDRPLIKKAKDDEQTILAVSLALRQADDFLDDPSKLDGVEIYDNLRKMALTLSASGNWEQALATADKAVRISEVENGKESYPSGLARMQRADIYYKIGSNKLAEEDYAALISLLEKYTIGEGERSFCLARLGNCYFLDGAFDQSEQCYEKALQFWKSPKRVHSRLLRTVEGFGLHDAPSINLVAVSYSRLANIFDRQGDGSIRQPIGDKLPKEELYRRAALLYYQALPMWRQLESENSKNTALCELNLAALIDKCPKIELERYSSRYDLPEMQLKDRNVRALYKASLAAFRESVGPLDPAYAQALLQYGNYCWNKDHDLLTYLSMRYQACTILGAAQH